MEIRLHVGYALIALGYMLGIFMLSELPAQGGAGLIDPVPGILQNALHVPLFAGLTWCLFLSLSDGQWNRRVSRPFYGMIGALAGTYAAFDEWHQSLIFGRLANPGDFFLDCLGVGGLLLVHRLRLLLLCGNHR